MANTYLTRTIGTTGNRKTFTYSTWIKRGNIGSYQPFMGDVTDVGNDYFTVYFENPDKLQIYSQLGGPTVIHLSTNREFRDTSAWYHIVIATDTTQATASDRVKIYVNGVQETSFSVATYPNQNTDLAINISGETQEVGAGHTLSSYTFDGSMSHVHFIDGTAYDATAFGEYDANGVWKIKTSPSVTYGTNGFFILKDGNSVTDQSGNSNNFTVAGGTLTNTEDSPSNVFSVWNSLANQGSVTLDNGNTRASFTAGGWNFVYSTLGASSGKYYYEVKVANTGSDSNIGIMEMDTATNEQGTADNVGKNTESVAYQKNGSIKKNNSNVQTGLTALVNGNILGIAMDLDGNTIQFYLNGSSVGSAVSIASDKTYAFATSGYGSSEHQTNFGNGYFGTTAVSSAGTNASGIGIFEHDVPAGFTALSTKGLNL